MKIDKFSFAVGVFAVLLIIGCVAQVSTGGDGRYQFIEPTAYGIDGDPVSSRPAWFSILDTGTGTVNVWTQGGEVGVYQFQH